MYNWEAFSWFLLNPLAVSSPTNKQTNRCKKRYKIKKFIGDLCQLKLLGQKIQTYSSQPCKSLCFLWSLSLTQCAHSENRNIFQELSAHGEQSIYYEWVGKDDSQPFNISWLTKQRCDNSITCIFRNYRMTEWLALEGTSGDRLVQPPC